MAKVVTQYVCQSCGASYPRWSGRCEACGAWNTITEEAPRESAPKGLTGKGGRKIEFTGLADESVREAERRVTGIAEFDRVTGGGLVRGSALLIGGDPGIGKSTLLLQVVAALGAPAAGTGAGHSADISVPARGRWRRCGSGPSASASPRRPCISPPRPACVTLSPASTAPTRRRWWSSI